MISIIIRLEGEKVYEGEFRTVEEIEYRKFDVPAIIKKYLASKLVRRKRYYSS